MVNEKGRPKIKNVNWRMTSFYISDAFKPTWEKIKKLANIDKLNSEEFKRYCQTIEGVDVTQRNQGIMTMYLHFILTNHTIQNVYKLTKQ